MTKPVFFPTTAHQSEIKAFSRHIKYADPSMSKKGMHRHASLAQIISPEISVITEQILKDQIIGKILSTFPEE